MNSTATATAANKGSEQPKKSGPTSRRAESLARRIEEGAAGLAAFAESLSETEWSKVVAESNGRGRSVGVIVHHVASVYPIEIQLAQPYRRSSSGRERRSAMCAAIGRRSNHRIGRGPRSERSTELRFIGRLRAGRPWRR